MTLTHVYCTSSAEHKFKLASALGQVDRYQAEADQRRTRIVRSETRVPVEVFSKSFSFLRGNKKLLVPCTLVSSTWRQVSIPHLHHTLVFFDEKPFEPFFEFVNTDPRLARHIVDLTFLGAGTTDGSKLDCGALSAALLSLPALSWLTIKQLTIRSASPPPAPRELRLLDVWRVRGDEHPTEPDALATMLSYFRAESLIIDPTPYWEDTSGFEATPSVSGSLVPQSVAIRNLGMGSYTEAHERYYRLFHVVLAPDALRRLDTTIDGNLGSIHALHRLLRSPAGCNLSSMNLHLINYSRVVYRQDVAVRWSVVGQALSACPHLRALRLGLGYNCRGVVETPSADLPYNRSRTPISCLRRHLHSRC
ncbi:hypothetical protein C8Q80DRAFT_354897 [Daedaleopsis nitida]|nr:hypothetical protein C8Q80DRAFT_354897 [Daedaleopsis nitida]